MGSLPCVGLLDSVMSSETATWSCGLWFARGFFCAELCVFESRWKTQFILCVLLQHISLKSLMKPMTYWRINHICDSCAVLQWLSSLCLWLCISSWVLCWHALCGCCVFHAVAPLFHRNKWKQHDLSNTTKSCWHHENNVSAKSKSGFVVGNMQIFRSWGTHDLTCYNVHAFFLAVLRQHKDSL